MKFYSKEFEFTTANYKTARKEIRDQIKQAFGLNDGFKLPISAIKEQGLFKSNEGQNWLTISDLASDAKAWDGVNKYRLFADLKHKTPKLRTQKLRDIIDGITNKTVNKLLELQEPAYYYEGSLNDNYLFINYDYKQRKGLAIGTKTPRHYINIKEVYINEWSSGLELIQTDKDKLFNEFVEECTANGGSCY